MCILCNKVNGWDNWIIIFHKKLILTLNFYLLNLFSDYTKDHAFHMSHSPVSINSELPKGPITTFASFESRLLCGYGQYLLELSHTSLTERGNCKVGAKPCNNITGVVVLRNKVFVICRELHQVKVFNGKDWTEPPEIIDCFEILKHEQEDVNERDCRAISVAIVERSHLWIGCQSGQVIILDVNTTKNSKPLNVITRSKSSVRSITVCPRLSVGASLSVLTSGSGFRPWSNSEQETEDDKMDGFVLVWDAELPKQKKHMLTEHKKREELAEQMAYEM